MINGKSVLAIIPARGGSKRLPGKNIKTLSDKPLIAWTIEAALGCTYLDEVMVTTDDRHIAEVSLKYGAHVPFIRPAVLASDTASSFDAIKHAIDFYRHEVGRNFDFVILLQPTSPLRDTQDISNALELLVKKNADAIISVCEADHSPRWMNVLPPDHSMVGFVHQDVKNKRSQDLETFYRLNGAIYICNVKILLKNKTWLLDDAIYAYPMSTEHSVDIDTLFDFVVANAFLQNSVLKV